MDVSEDSKLVLNLRKIVAWGMGFICGSAIFYFGQFNEGLSDNQADWGSFGSYLGGVTGPVLSFISIIFFYYTFSKQVEQQEVNQKNQQEIQKQTNVSSFETSFFNLLMIFHSSEAATSVKIWQNQKGDKSSFENEAKGKQVFDLLFKHFEEEYANYINTGSGNDICISESKEKYEGYYNYYGYILGHYFRALYNIVVFIESHEDIDKNKYLNILMSNLSNSQLALLLFNILSKYGDKKFQPLVIKYNLLQNLNTNNRTTLNLVYSAFKDLKM